MAVKFSALAESGALRVTVPAVPLKTAAFSVPEAGHATALEPFHHVEAELSQRPAPPRVEVPVLDQLRDDCAKDAEEKVKARGSEASARKRRRLEREEIWRGDTGVVVMGRKDGLG